MKLILQVIACILLAVIATFISCKKQKSCEDCKEDNKPPIAVAGSDQVITLPTDSASLDGSASSDPDGTISEWLWKKITGPTSFNIANTSTPKTIVKNLGAGTYQFELKVTDNGGLSAIDTIQITLQIGVTDSTQANYPPLAIAGANQNITAFANSCITGNTPSVKLNGSSSYDPDGTITSYQWTKISGPSYYTIASPNAAQTDVNDLIEGTYQFELKIIDNGGLSGRDTVQIAVTAQPSLNCDNSARPVINARLVPIGTLSELRSYVSVASAGNKILFAGGMVREIPGSTLNIYSSRVDIYDIGTQTWSTAELSLARFDMATVAIGNKIFFGGGENGDGSYCSDVVDIYDASINQWSVASLSEPRNAATAAAVGTKVFFAGGCAHSKSADIYDLATNRWSSASLSQGRNYPIAITANDKIYFAGGEWFAGPGNYGPSDLIDVYDNLSDTWSVCNLAEPKLFFAGIAAGRKLIWAGGSNGTGVSDLVEITDLNTGSKTICHLSSPAGFYTNAGQTPVIKNNKIVFTVAPDKFDIYDLATNTWSIGLLPIKIAQASLISVNDVIYVAGGFVDGVQSNQVWKLEF